jgi:hypothetical protein
MPLALAVGKHELVAQFDHPSWKMYKITKDMNTVTNTTSQRRQNKMAKKMKFIVTAKLLNTYEVEVMATDAAAAIASLDEWVAEDFEDYLENQQWDLETC